MYATQFHARWQKWEFLRRFFELSPGDGMVTARYMGMPKFNRDPRGEENITPREAPKEKHPTTSSEHNPLEKLTLKEPVLLEAIVGAAIKFRDGAEELYFPSAKLDYPAKLKLWQYCQSSNWKFIDQEEDGLTLTRRDIDPELLWQPDT